MGSIPPLHVTSLFIVHLGGGSMGLAAGGVKQYVEKYGRDGWLQGLHDDHMCTSPGSPKEYEFRTKDIVYCYFISMYDTHLPGFQETLTLVERDEMIRSAEAEIQRNPDFPKRPTLHAD